MRCNKLKGDGCETACTGTRDTQCVYVPRAQGLATQVTAPTGRVSQAWHVYASTRTLSVSGCTREQETRLEDTQRSRAEVGCDAATTEGYRPVCFDKQSRISVEWRLSGTLAWIAI